MIWTQICFRPGAISGPDVARASKTFLGFEGKFIKIHRSLRTTKFNQEKHFQVLEDIERFPNVTIAEASPDKLEEKQSFESIRITPYVEVLNWFTTDPIPDAIVETIASGQEAFSLATVHDKDDIHWQSEEQVDVYEYAGRAYSQDDVIPHPLFERAIDISRNPGRREIFPGMLIQPSWKMWFGPWAFRYFPRDKLLQFQDAYRVEERQDLVFVQLFENLKDFEKEESRVRQQAFRDWMGIDELMKCKDSIFERDLAPLSSEPDDDAVIITSG